MKTLEELLQACAALHTRLCPRQVLGVRMGLLAARLFEIFVPQADKRLLIIAETDGCMVDGLSTATGCRVGRRTLRIEDYGKVAAPFIDTRTGQALRIAPSPASRMLAQGYAPEARNRWEAQLIGYQRMPAESLLSWRPVSLARPLADLLGQAGERTVYALCCEEIINQREVVRDGLSLCRACAGQAYYNTLPTPDSRFPRQTEPALWRKRPLAQDNCGAVEPEASA